MRNQIIFGILFLIPALIHAQEMIPSQPRGGERQAREFIDEEMIYPEDALKQKTEGTVAFTFIVGTKGEIRDLTISKSISPSLDMEAKRIFSFLVWQPAVYRGKAVESKSVFEVPFSLRRYNKACRNRGYRSFPLPEAPIDSPGKIYSYQDAFSKPEPVFASASMDMKQFMAENFHYPDEALRRNITGTVRINFIVEPHGHISNVMVTEHVGAGCSEEAIRLLKLLKWKPGQAEGKNIRVNLTIPISFGLSTDGGYKVTPASGGTTFQ